MREPFRVYRVGRFEMSFPTAFSAPIPATQMLGSEVRELLVPPGSSFDGGFESVWRERLVNSRKAAGRPYAYRLVREQDLGKGERLFEMESDLSEGEIKELGREHVIEALLSRKDVVVSIRHVWVTDVPGFPSTPELQRSKQRGIDAFHALIRAVHLAREPADPNSYYLSRTMIAIGPEQVARGSDENEITSVNVNDPSRRFSLTLRSTFPWVPEQEGERGFISGMLQAVLSLGEGYGAVRSGKHSVAGMDGEEVVVQRGKSGKLSFTWGQIPKRPSSGYKPDLEIDMEAPGSSREEALAVWDAILNSIKPLPQPQE